MATNWEDIGTVVDIAPKPQEEEPPKEIPQHGRSAGIVEPGNIKDLYERPTLDNPDGTVSTTSSKSFSFDGVETLLPTVINGKRLTDEEAIAHFKKTGEHLGKFTTPEAANKYAVNLHNEQERRMDKPAASGWEAVGKVIPIGEGETPKVSLPTQELTSQDRIALAQADNPREMKKYLSTVYGEGNVKQDKTGQIYLTKDNKRIAINESSFVDKMIGTMPEWAGMAAGSAAGFELGTAAGVAFPPLAPWAMGLGAIGGSIVGGVAGKVGIETMKALSGRWEKDAQEYIDSLKHTAYVSAGGEMGAGIVGKVGSKILRGPLPQWLTQTTPESRAMTEQQLAEGAIPEAQSAVPGMKRIQFVAALARKAVGTVDRQMKANAALVQNRIMSILTSSGIPEEEVKPTLAILRTDEARLPTKDVGGAMQKAFQAHRDMLQNNVNKRVTELDTWVNGQMKRLDTLTRRFAPVNTGKIIPEAIIQSKKDFNNAFSKVYDKIDSIVGNKELYPTKFVNDATNRLLSKLPVAGQTALVKELRLVGIDVEKLLTDALFEPVAGALPKAAPTTSQGFISFGNAQRILGRLHDAMDRGLVPSTNDHEIGTLIQAMEQGFQAAAKNPEAAPAVKLLNAVRPKYNVGIGKYKDAVVNKLVNDLQTTNKQIPADPEEIARVILQPRYTARVLAIKGMVGADTWKAVVGADYSRMIESATNKATRKVSGIQLLSQITERRGLMNIVYGPQKTAEIRELAQAMAERDGELPLEALTPGAARPALARLKAEKEAQDKFMKENALSTLANPMKAKEAVYDFLVNPEHGDLLGQAIKLVGENSPEVRGLQQAAIKQVLINAKMEIASGNSERALTLAMKKYTTEQQKLLFPNGLDEDIKLLGKHIEDIMRDLSDESKASFAASAVLGSPIPIRLPVQAGLAFYQQIFASQTAIRYMALGLRNPSGVKRALTKEAIKDLMRYNSVAPAPERLEEPPPEQPQ